MAKEFRNGIEIPIEAYDAAAWDGSKRAVTQDAIRDKIESLALGSPGAGNALSGYSLTGHTPNKTAAAGTTNLGDLINLLFTALLELQNTGVHIVEPYGVAITDRVTAIEADTNVYSFHLPYACRIVDVKLNADTVSSSGNVVVDLNVSGTSILGTNKLRIDATDDSSLDSSLAVDFDETDTYANDQKITVDIDSPGTGTKGLVLTLYLVRLAEVEAPEPTLTYPICTKVRFFPRDGLAFRAGLGKVQGSNTSTTEGFEDLGTLPEFPVDGWQTYTFANTTEYKYLRIDYTGLTQDGDMAEVEFKTAADVTITKVSAFGDNWYNQPDPTYGFENVFDGDTSTALAGATFGDPFYGIEVAPEE